MDSKIIRLGTLAVVVSGFLLGTNNSTSVAEKSRDTAASSVSYVPRMVLKPTDAHSKLNDEPVQEPAHRPPPPPPPSPPPPPPAGTGKGRITQSPIERPRTFIGSDRAQVKSIEQALPQGSSVYVGPVGVDYETAAIAEADLDGDGVVDTVAVHTQRQATATEPRPALMLSILSRQGKRYFVRMSISLVGSVLFNIDSTEGLRPIVIQDITGDGKLKIVLAPGPSASLGGWLEAYDVHGAEFRRLVHINGRYFSLRSNGMDRAVSISTRWMEEDVETVFSWNGTDFQRVSPPR